MLSIASAFVPELIAGSIRRGAMSGPLVKGSGSGAPLVKSSGSSAPLIKLNK